MDKDKAQAYTTHIADQLSQAVAAGDAATANAIVDRVAGDGHHQFAADLNTALTRTSLAGADEDQR